MSANDSKDKANWDTFWVRIWKGSEPNRKGQEALDHIRATQARLCEPFQAPIDWTVDATSCTIDEMRYWVPTAFNNYGGRVTLAGDAAHPMLPCKRRYNRRTGCFTDVEA